ncbi:kinase-like domain-containing protein [Rhizophagus irregularis DAOM 181602=DAOM 197198]|nr:kinase-like domain-containing protein [Rhizophagus irregularis DAOM 181602=DAOM 197198]
MSNGITHAKCAYWINGRYEEWDSEKKQLERVKRPGVQNLAEEVVLKTLENVESANQSWFEEAKSHLTIKEEQEGFHSKLYDFNIPNNINDFNKSNKRNSKSSKVITIFRGDSEKLSKEFKKLQINSNNDEKKITQQHVDDDDEVYNNPNLHSEEQDELEIPDDGF